MQSLPVRPATHKNVSLLKGPHEDFVRLVAGILILGGATVLMGTCLVVGLVVCQYDSSWNMPFAIASVVCFILFLNASIIVPMVLFD